MNTNNDDYEFKRETLVEACKQMLSEGQDIDSVISFLRQNGCNHIECMIALRRAGLSFAKAKEAVATSKAWEDDPYRGPSLDDLD